MSSNAGERDVARRMGFGRPRPQLQFSLPASKRDPSRSLLDILGVRSGQKAVLVGVSAAHLPAAGAYSAVRSSPSAPLRPVDVIIYQVSSAFGLRRVRELSALVKEGGALWVLWPHGEAHITRNHVQSSGLAVGMVDVALVGVSEQLTALKFVHGRKEQ